MTFVTPDVLAREICHDSNKLALLAFAATRNEEIRAHLQQGDVPDDVLATPPPLDREALLCLFGARACQVLRADNNP